MCDRDRLAERESQRKGQQCLADRRDVLRKEKSSDKGFSAHDSLEVVAEREKERKHTGEGKRETPFLSRFPSFTPSTLILDYRLCFYFHILWWKYLIFCETLMSVR